jgi:NADPH-dependent 2,4-dienoyl-CoA reductase/sulfur reductase-like enzyme
MRTLDAEALVLATGAYDRALPFPGWDLPGVYTAGAAQALAKGQGIAVGRRVVVAGTGPFLLPVARSLLDAGARVVALLEANDAGTISRGWLEAPRSAGGKLGEFTSYAAALARHRIPFQLGRAVVMAHGKDRVDAVTTARLDREWNPVLGTEDHIEVDAVCVGYGFTAQLELAVSAGCVLVTGPDGGGAVQVDDDQHTSVPGIYVAGELTGIAGAAPAAAEGSVAGAAAAARLGHGSGPATAQRRKVADGRQLARALAAAYPVRPGWKTWLTDETLICRCEEVSYAQLRAMTELGTSGRALKLTSRAGLGLCQGRVCARNTADLAGAPADHAAGSRRPIAVPVRLRDLAATPVADTTMEEI